MNLCGPLPKQWGSIWGGPCSQDYHILGHAVGTLILGNYHLGSRDCNFGFRDLGLGYCGASKGLGFWV